jgi:hypothetical protein
MKQKTRGAAALCVALLMSACGDPSADGSNIREAKGSVADKASEQEEGGEYITAEGKDGSANSTTPPAQEPGQEIQGMEPFDIDVFNTHRAVWEKEPLLGYGFTQTHTGPGMDISVAIQILHGIPESLPDKNEPEPLLFCSTIPELYEKIAALWAEQRYTADSFLIKYNVPLNDDLPYQFYHYPAYIQIRNIDNSGGDYNVYILINNFAIYLGGEMWD